MTFDEFLKYCNFDIREEAGQTQIMAIFSAGFLKEFSTNFVKDNPEVAKRLVADDLYGYVKKELSDNG